MPSTYDSIHDQYWSTTTPKAGIRYERLAAAVFKSLNINSRVIHDIKLVGESEVKHQIDVTIESGTERKRTLIECKDFAVSTDKVGLSIIRDFSAVVEDTKPDLAIVITCIGFTSEAQKFAKHKGIKLAILREFQEMDWEGRIKKICVTMYIMHVSDPKVSLRLGKQDHMDSLRNDLVRAGLSGVGVHRSEPVYLNIESQKIQLLDFVQAKLNEYPREKAGPVKLNVPLNGNTIQVQSFPAIPIEGIDLEFEVLHHDESFDVTSNKIAKLILDGFEDKDIIVYEEDLKRLSIDEDTGEIKA